jgi:small subunit ribosomal protein S18
MARGNARTSSRRAPKDAGRKVKKKPCALCRDHVEWVDYKDVALLRKYMSDRGKIRSRRVTGNCAQHQRGVALAIKTARELVLLPYTQRTVTERPGSRRGRAAGERRRVGDEPVPDTEALVDGGDGEEEDVEEAVGDGAISGDEAVDVNEDEL